jgi:hypothetical protein
MSTLNATNIKHGSSGTNNIVLDPAGGTTIGNGLNITGDVSSTGDVQMASQNGGPLAGFRNQIINGSFAIAQRSTDVTPPTNGNVAGYLVSDRWFHSGANQNIGRVVQDKVSSTIGAPPGFDYTLHFVDASKTSRSAFGQTIELPLTGQRGAFAAGSQWTLSFYVNIDASAKTVENLTFADDYQNGNSVICGPNTGLSYTEIGSYADSWKRYSVTYTLNSTDPAATNNCLRVNLGTVTESGQLAITGCQLEPGPVATPFEHRPYGTELALCQRYFTFMECRREASPLWVSFPETMRTVPSITNLLGDSLNRVYESGYLQPAGGSNKQEIEADAEL